jgi:signal transduction histidine kinase
MRSAAWRISLWATLAFAIGTMAVFMFLHQFVSTDIQRRSDAWLSGEVEVLSDVANHTPQDALYGRVLGEVAELASREVPNRPRSSDGVNDSVFFLQTAADGSLALWVGAGNGSAELHAIQGSQIAPDTPFNLHVRDREIPFRVVAVRMENGGSIYLGLSERDELRVLKNLRLRFFLLWLLLVLLGFAIVFYSTRRMLGDVREITEAASRIGESDLSKRVPASRRHDEVAQLASTLNHMLDRIESSIHQLHTITDSLAHDLRSPLTAIRGKLEMLLSGDIPSEQIDSIVAAIEELDRLCEFLDSSLDVAEAKADALRLSRTTLDLNELLRVMIDLYEPSMAEKGLQVRLRSTGPLRISADASLIHRMVSNLLDNELNHLPAGRTISVALRSDSGDASLVIEDDGPGFSKDIGERLFEQGVKGGDSRGHGLGLAFVRAVVRAHGGSVSAVNRSEGGARLSIALPLIVEENGAERLPTLIAGEG